MFFQGGLDCQRFCSPLAAEMNKRFTTTAMVEGMEKVYRSIIGQATIRPEEQKLDSRSIK